MIRRIEALADTIGAHNGSADPTHPLFKLRNPGGLKAATMSKPQVGDFRVFESKVNGYQALLFDLEIKCRGKSFAGLKSDSPLRHLFRVYGFKDEQMPEMIDWLMRALGKYPLDFITVSEHTPISFFLE